jgi:O-antigen biosynthesis protein
MNATDRGGGRPALDAGIRRVRQAARVARADGPRGLAARVLRAATARVDAPSRALPVRAEEILAVAPPGAAPAAVPGMGGVRPLTPARPPAARPPTGTRPLTVTWVMTPPRPGSGGHHTLLRLVQYLEGAGHTCRICLYDRYGGEVRGHARVLRETWPGVRAPITDATGPIAPSDAVFATSWQTAYIVARPGIIGRRLYAVQDFEPAFYPAGSESALAESTYRFGFHGVTAGRWLAGKLAADYGMPCDHFEFGADTAVYRLGDPAGARRSGVVFYAKPDTPRRAYALGLLALTAFHQRHPDVPIHTFGADVGALPVPATRHGVITPAELNALYNTCLAGLCLSMTNMSLIPFEMLAAGCVPVVNDARHNRLVLDNPRVRYVPPVPADLARALSEAVSVPPARRAATATAAAASVAHLSWDAAGAAVERVLRGQPRPGGALLAADAAGAGS